MSALSPVGPNEIGPGGYKNHVPCDESMPQFRTVMTHNTPSPAYPHPDHYRTWYDYRTDVPTDRLSENAVPLDKYSSGVDGQVKEFEVETVEPLDEPEEDSDRWTCILIHGMGISPSHMAPVLEHWQASFRTWRFLLPHAQHLPVSMSSGFPVTAWHDVFELGTDNVPPRGWPNMAHSVTRIRTLIREEMKRGTPSNQIILAGFSQGAHLAFATAFNSDMELGAVVSLSGFYSNPNHYNAVAEIESSVNRNTPVFLGHGEQDSILPIYAAECSFGALKVAGNNVQFHRYQDMDHEYNRVEVLRDSAAFLDLVVDGHAQYLPVKTIVRPTQKPVKKRKQPVK